MSPPLPAARGITTFHSFVGISIAFSHRQAGDRNRGQHRQQLSLSQFVPPKFISSTSDRPSRAGGGDLFRVFSRSPREDLRSSANPTLLACRPIRLVTTKTSASSAAVAPKRSAFWMVNAGADLVEMCRRDIARNDHELADLRFQAAGRPMSGEILVGLEIVWRELKYLLVVILPEPTALQELSLDLFLLRRQRAGRQRAIPPSATRRPEWACPSSSCAFPCRTRSCTLRRSRCPKLPAAMRSPCAVMQGGRWI